MSHTLEIELQHFLLGPPENFAEIGVALEKASAARVYKSDADWRSFIYRSESALALFQRLVCSFTLCDVLQHARHPVDPTRPFDGRVRDEQVSLAPRRVGVSHFVSHDLALEALIQLFLDGRLKDSGVQYLRNAAAKQFLFLHPPIVQEGTVRDHIAVTAVHY